MAQLVTALTEALIVKRERIWAEFFATHALLQPGGEEVAELRAAQVPPACILSLYPLDMVELPELIQVRLRSPEQVWQFTTDMERTSESDLAAIYDRMSETSYNALREQARRLFLKSHNFNALSDQFRAVDEGSFRRKSAYEAVRDALLNAADILWLAANWESLPELRGCELTFCKQLVALRQALGGAHAAVSEKSQA